MTLSKTQDMEAVVMTDKAICSTYDILEEISRNKQERMAYEARQGFLTDMLMNELSVEERSRKEGRINATRIFIVMGMNIDEFCETLYLSGEDLL